MLNAEQLKALVNRGEINTVFDWAARTGNLRKGTNS